MDNTFVTRNFRNRDGTVAFVGEIDANITGQVMQCLAARIGYQLMWKKELRWHPSNSNNRPSRLMPQSTTAASPASRPTGKRLADPSDRHYRYFLHLLELAHIGIYNPDSAADVLLRLASSVLV